MKIMTGLASLIVCLVALLPTHPVSAQSQLAICWVVEASNYTLIARDVSGDACQQIAQAIQDGSKNKIQWLWTNDEMIDNQRLCWLRDDTTKHWQPVTKSLKYNREYDVMKGECMNIIKGIAAAQRTSLIGGYNHEYFITDGTYEPLPYSDPDADQGSY